MIPIFFLVLPWLYSTKSVLGQITTAENSSGGDTVSIIRSNQHGLLAISIMVEDEVSATTYGGYCNEMEQNQEIFSISVEEITLDAYNNNNESLASPLLPSLSSSLYRQHVPLKWNRTREIDHPIMRNDRDTIKSCQREYNSNIRDTNKTSLQSLQGRRIFRSGIANYSFLVPLVHHHNSLSAFPSSHKTRTFIVSLSKTRTTKDTTIARDNEDETTTLLTRRLATLPQTTDPVVKLLLYYHQKRLLCEDPCQSTQSSSKIQFWDYYCYVNNSFLGIILWTIISLCCIFYNTNDNGYSNFVHNDEEVKIGHKEDVDLDDNDENEEEEEEEEEQEEEEQVVVEEEDDDDDDDDDCGVKDDGSSYDQNDYYCCNEQLEETEEEKRESEQFSFDAASSPLDSTTRTSLENHPIDLCENNLLDTEDVCTRASVRCTFPSTTYFSDNNTLIANNLFENNLSGTQDVCTRASVGCTFPSTTYFSDKKNLVTEDDSSRQKKYNSTLSIDDIKFLSKGFPLSDEETENFPVNQSPSNANKSNEKHNNSSPIHNGCILNNDFTRKKRYDNAVHRKTIIDHPKKTQVGALEVKPQVASHTISISQEKLHNYTQIRSKQSFYRESRALYLPNQDRDVSGTESINYNKKPTTQDSVSEQVDSFSNIYETEVEDKQTDLSERTRKLNVLEGHVLKANEVLRPIQKRKPRWIKELENHLSEPQEDSGMPEGRKNAAPNPEKVQTTPSDKGQKSYSPRSSNPPRGQEILTQFSDENMNQSCSYAKTSPGRVFEELIVKSTVVQRNEQEIMDNIVVTSASTNCNLKCHNTKSPNSESYVSTLPPDSDCGSDDDPFEFSCQEEYYRPINTLVGMNIQPQTHKSLNSSQSRKRRKLSRPNESSREANDNSSKKNILPSTDSERSKQSRKSKNETDSSVEFVRTIRSDKRPFTKSNYVADWVPSNSMQKISQNFFGKEESNWEIATPDETPSLPKSIYFHQGTGISSLPISNSKISSKKNL